MSAPGSEVVCETEPSFRFRLLPVAVFVPGPPPEAPEGAPPLEPPPSRKAGQY